MVCLPAVAGCQSDQTRSVLRQGGLRGSDHLQTANRHPICIISIGWKLSGSSGRRRLISASFFRSGLDRLEGIPAYSSPIIRCHYSGPF
jgi:hypothetical protein